MRKIKTEVLVIGGGATGTGVLRDLAMRGFAAVLVEQRDLSHGTTGRYHGLLHSGGRYVVKDPQAARECIIENQILRRIMPHCIEDTGGFFVLTPHDDPDYPHYFLAGCKAAGIPVEEISIHQMLREEPYLNPEINRCFRVPDAAADSFLASELNAASAKEHGAKVLTYHPLHALLRNGDRVTGAICENLLTGESVHIEADLVINAAGAWAGKVAEKANLIVRILPGKGTLVALCHRFLNTVVNRCKIPSDGDIIVPIHTVSVIGTTDIQISDPNRVSIELWEVNLLLEEGGKLVPGLKEMRILRAWAGIRPLYQDSATSRSRDISRAFTLLDHERRDGVSGFITITSGKWTTYRLMAEETVDLVCKKLGVERPCRTQSEPLPGSTSKKYYHLGERLDKVEKDDTFGTLFCECEYVTRDVLVKAILNEGANTLDDIRRDVRLGMGPCQGGFCTIRAAGLLHELKNPGVEQTNGAIRDFLEERWKGLVPVLWGAQLRQERLNEFIYLNLLSIDQLPGTAYGGRLSAELYESPLAIEEVRRESMAGPKEGHHRSVLPPGASDNQPFEWIVIGGGLAGLFTTWLLASKGRRTALITMGWGRTHWSTGCIDVLGHFPGENQYPITDLTRALRKLKQVNPVHPYSILGRRILDEAIECFLEFCGANGYPFKGSLEKNWLLPTSLGAQRPTCLAPLTMVAGDLSNKDPMLIVGFEGFTDFYPSLIAENLASSGYPARGILLDLHLLREKKIKSPFHLAVLFEHAAFRDELITALRARLGDAGRIGLPAVLGIENAASIHAELEGELGLPVFEIPGLPPSVPGIRIHNLLVNSIRESGGRIFNGLKVSRYESKNGAIASVQSEAAARLVNQRAEHFVLATGGILGGGITGKEDGSLKETIFQLPCVGPGSKMDWFTPQFLGPEGQPVYLTGAVANKQLWPIDQNDRVLFSNLHIAGTILAGGDYLRERSMDGVDLVSAFKIGRSAEP
jgi:glycerol-3-phosphate dehydrogenase